MTPFTQQEIQAANDMFPDKKRGSDKNDLHWAAQRGAFLAGIAYAHDNSKCPNEEWECTKIQRRLEAEISNLKQEVAGGSWALVKQIEQLQAELAEANAMLTAQVDL